MNEVYTCLRVFLHVFGLPKWMDEWNSQCRECWTDEKTSCRKSLYSHDTTVIYLQLSFIHLIDIYKYLHNQWIIPKKIIKMGIRHTKIYVGQV